MTDCILSSGSLITENREGVETFTSLDRDGIATAFLPPGVFEDLEGQDAGIIFAVYDDSILFPIDRGGEKAAVGTPVASATVAGEMIDNLRENVLIILRLNPVQDQVG